MPLLWLLFVAAMCRRYRCVGTPHWGAVCPRLLWDGAGMQEAQWRRWAMGS